TDETVGGLAPHSVHVVVWDGLLEDADDDLIAQAIHNEIAGGIAASVGSESGTAIDSEGNEKVILFDRATVVPLYCAATVTGVADEADVKAAIKARMPSTIAPVLSYVEAAASPMPREGGGVPGITDVTAFTIDTVFPPV